MLNNHTLPHYPFPVLTTIGICLAHDSRLKVLFTLFEQEASVNSELLFIKQDLITCFPPSETPKHQLAIREKYALP